MAQQRPVQTEAECQVYYLRGQTVMIRCVLKYTSEKICEEFLQKNPVGFQSPQERDCGLVGVSRSRKPGHNKDMAVLIDGTVSVHHPDVCSDVYMWLCVVASCNYFAPLGPEIDWQRV